MRRLRISAISYLNTAPLMWDFEEHPSVNSNRGAGGEKIKIPTLSLPKAQGQGWGTHFDISYTLPSSCARALAEGTADIGIIPAAAYAQIPGLQILPDVAIASRRAVRSILLVSQIPVELVRTVALDTSSMTSVALTKILFEKWMGGGRKYTSMEPDIEKMLDQCDAGLLIGDPALKVDRRKYHTLDLAEEWIRYTGKPFVFAFWAVRGEALREADPALDLAAVFRESRDHGLQAQNLECIARDWAVRVGLSESEVRTYLRENIHYQLDAGCLEGLQLFYRYGDELGIFPAAPELRFVPVANNVVS